jgi:uncharacterized membrane protein YhaH (DUF805 family)
MNWQFLFLSANGRIGQKDFWMGILILFGISVIGAFIPGLNMILPLLLIYPGVCVTSKRLHDFGKTGWLAAVPYGAQAIATVLSLVMGGAAIFGAASGTAAGAGGAMAAVGGMMLIWALVLLLCIGFLLWVGLTKGDPASNQYGSPTPSMFGGATTTTPTV